MNILDIENFDKYDYNNEETSSKLQKNFFLPKHKFRLIIAGSSASGKSNLTLNLIKNQLVFDKLYIFSRHLEQPKYVYLKNYFDAMDNLLEKDYNIKHKTIELFEETLDNIPILDELDTKHKKLFVFDDFNIMTKKQESLINDYFTRCRHKNCSIIFIGQIYFLIPRAVRLNLSHIILFNNGNNKEISLLYNELGSDLTKEQFKKMYLEATSPKYNFLLIDKNTDDIMLKYRKNFNEIYIPKII